jgi:hypothetical protein
MGRSVGFLRGNNIDEIQKVLKPFYEILRKMRKTYNFC